jgi:hypothetical protein
LGEAHPEILLAAFVLLSVFVSTLLLGAVYSGEEGSKKSMTPSFDAKSYGKRQA